MRFLFVDRINSVTDTTISGGMTFGPEEPLQYSLPGGDRQVAPGVVSEAIGQLASWLCLKKNDFTARPVFLFADSIRVDHIIPPGSNVDLQAEITSMDAETFNFSGKAILNGQVIQSIENCNGYFMPLEQLEDVDTARSRYRAMSEGGLKLDGRESPLFDFSGLIDEVIELEKEHHVTATKTFGTDYLFYKDHFPRFPVTPIVMLNELIGEAARKMLCSSQDATLFCQEVSGIKIKSFVKPGDAVTVKVQVLKKTPVEGGTQYSTVAELIKNEKRILRGRYVYKMTGVQHAN